MLIASRVASRFAVGTALPATRFSASLPYRITPSTNAALLSRGNVNLGSQRSYATPGRPKKGSIEESSRKSRPRKTKAATSDESTKPKAVKAPKEKSTRPRAVKAPKEESVEAKAARKAKDAAKKASAEQKKQQRAARLAASKQKQKERVAAKKQKAKERAALKKSREKARKERAAAETKAKAKEVSEKQKTRLKTRQAAEALKELKQAALSPPKLNPKFSAYMAFIKERMKEKSGNNPDNKSFNTLFAETSAEWKQLNPAQHEHYNHLARQEIETNRQQYNDYVQQYTPDQIRVANAARSRLRKTEKKRKATAYSQWPAIEDDRQVPHPGNHPFLLFSNDRRASGDFKNIALADVSKLLGQEWKALGESEKQKYVDQVHRQREQYNKEYREVYGHEPASPRSGVQAATSTE
ncbi:hypothetical protein MBLNU457_5584t1 [Dothideomycetes sp. NU457]